MGKPCVCGHAKYMHQGRGYRGRCWAGRDQPMHGRMGRMAECDCQEYEFKGDTMEAQREDFVRFVSDVRLLLEGPDGVFNDEGGPMTQETLLRLNHKLARKYADWGDGPEPSRPAPVKTARADGSLGWGDGPGGIS